MADVVAQNLLSQQMTQIMTQAVSGNHIYEQMKQIMSQSLLGNHLSLLHLISSSELAINNFFLFLVN